MDKSFAFLLQAWTAWYREEGRQRDGEEGRREVSVHGERERERTRLTGQVVCGNDRLGNLCGWGHQSAASVFFQTVGTDSNKADNIHNEHTNCVCR